MIPLPLALGLYQDRSLPNSNQMCKNWYPSIVQTQGLSQQVLYGTPGLNQVATTGGVSRINRGSHTKEGIPYFVQGDRLYNLIKTTPLGVDTYTVNDLGEITGTDRVSMDDNGTQLMIVANGQGWIYDESMGFTSRETPGGSQMFKVAYGGGQFVCVGGTGAATDQVLTSPDGITWTQRTAAADLSWTEVAYGNSVWVSLASFGTGDWAMSSTDGITWTQRIPASTNQWTGLVYGDGLFVAVSRGGTSDRVQTSPDGITWTSRTTTDETWRGVTYGNGLYVAVADTGDIMTSPDAITWTVRDAQSDAGFRAITYGEGLYVATGFRISATSEGVCFTSIDGITWIERTVPDGFWSSLSYGAGMFVAGNATYDGSSNITMTSKDGILWEARTASFTGSGKPNSVAFGEGLFVISSSLSFSPDTAQQILTSIGGGDHLMNIVDYDTDFDANGTPEKVRFIDSYFLVTTNGKKFIRSDANNGLSWNALNFGTAEADPDAIKGLEIDNNKAYLFGSETIEPFDNVGGSGFGFQRSGLLYNKGAISGDALIKTTAGIAFFGQGKDESPAMWSLSAGQLVKISHPGIDNEVNGYSLADLNACFAQYYAEAGEFFVSFTFPLKTFVYGFASELWHERESSGLRWRVNSITKAYGTIFAGDSIDGRIGEMALDIYHEYDNYIEAQVSGPNFSNQGDRAFYPKIEATMEAGVGNADTPDPVLTYDYTDTGKPPWIGARARNIGKEGVYDKRAIWRRNGSAPRFRTNRFTFTGKTKRAFLKLEADIEA